MKIQTLINRIRGQFSSRQEIPEDVVVKFLQVLEKAREEDLSCGDIYAKLDEFVESEVKGRDAAKLAPLVREHLDMCSECCDEYEALLSVLEHTHNEN